MAERFREENPPEHGVSTRSKALAIASFLRAHNLTGIESDANYRDLQNNFIGVALSEKTHPSLPLISVAIFCAVAERLGVDARPCGFPLHVYAIVYPPSGLTLDHRPAPSNTEPEMMYLDPFQSDQEVPADFLRERLRSYGAAPSAFPELLRHASIPQIVTRTAHNVMQSVREHKRRNATLGTTGNRTLSVSHRLNLDLESAYYGALWAMVILGPGSNGEEGDEDDPLAPGNHAAHVLSIIVQFIETNFPEDVALIEQCVEPLFQHLPLYQPLRHMISVTRDADERPKPSHPRDGTVAGRVKYKVGQLFRHRRYGYVGLITGWDAKCEAREDWMQRMGVDELPGGRRQSFYHVL